MPLDPAQQGLSDTFHNPRAQDTQVGCSRSFALPRTFKPAEPAMVASEELDAAARIKKPIVASQYLGEGC